MLEFRHAIVVVSDMKRSIEFYGDILGLPPRFESAEWTVFDTRESAFALRQTSMTPAPGDPGDGNLAGRCHPSFTVDNIDAYHERLTREGVVCVRPPMIEDHGRKLAKYVDPDGLLFTLSQATSEHVFHEELETSGPRVMLYTDGKGNWWRRAWMQQCAETILILDRRQGVEGHDGDHWCFKKDGSFAWSRDKDHPEYKDAASGWTPPGHPKYRTPMEMRQHHFMSHFTDSEVTDADEVARLERGEVKDGESINRPCTPEEIERLGLGSRMR